MNDNPTAEGTALVAEPSLMTEAMALLASANEHTTRERRVLKSAVQKVAMREWENFSMLPTESRKVATLKAVRQFLRVATETPSLTASQGERPFHADLLPSCHPLSTRTGTDDRRARWLAADPAVPEEVRPLLAAAIEFPDTTVEGIHARQRLRSHKIPAVLNEQISQHKHKDTPD